MNDNKRNVTGSYPGADGAPRRSKKVNPAGAYPTRPKTNPAEEPAVGPAPAERPVKKIKRFRFSRLFSKETMRRYWKELTYYAGILVVSILLAVWVCGVGNEVLGLIRPDKEIVVTVEENSSTMEIAKELKKAGVIDHPYIFRLYCKLKKADGNFQHGEYTLNCQRDYNQLIAALRRTASDRKTVTFTIEPGCTQEEFISALCDSLGYCDRTELEKVLQTYDFSGYDFLKNLPKRRARLEGYLYPGEYEMYEGESALAVVERVLDRFEQQVLTEENKRLLSNSDYSLDQLITLASILQCEAGDQMNKAAGVYYNRLKSAAFPYLESQATVAYILPAGTETVTANDIRTDDTYNTYRSRGLPPGPIANPGGAAISAVLSPESTDSFYFITKSDGSVVFAVTESEQQANLRAAGEHLRGTGTVQ